MYTKQKSLYKRVIHLYFNFHLLRDNNFNFTIKHKTNYQYFHLLAIYCFGFLFQKHIKIDLLNHN